MLIKSNPSNPTRRAVLKGIGVTLALPWLDAVGGLGGSAMAQQASTGTAANAAAAFTGIAPSGAPIRLAAMFMPNGVNVAHWDATSEGAHLRLSPTLSPLEKHKQQITILKGLWNQRANRGDGHYAKTANFLSGEVVRKTKGKDLHVGQSMDQLVAQRLAGQTPLSSMVLATEPTRGGVDVNVGFTQLYGGHISWSSPTTPVPKEIYPRQAFDRLFRDAAGRKTDKSILDAVLAEANALQGEVGRDDREKLDAYFESIRQVENRIVAMEKLGGEQWTPDVVVDPEDLTRPGEGLPEDPTEHIRLMLDLIVLGFQMNKTRVASMMFGNAVSGRNMTFLHGVRGGHHEISHHQNNQDKLTQYQRINRYFIEHLAYIIDRMASIPEGDGTLLNHSMLLFGSGLSDGNSHNPRNLPIVVAGGGGGTIRTGRVIDCGEGEKLCALHLSLMQRMGVGIDRFGDANQPVDLLG